MKLTLAIAALTMGLAGCASTGVEQYRAEQPALDLKTYLNGTLDAWGIFQGRSGEVQNRFHVVIDAKWTGDTGVLDENFKWSDGTTSTPHVEGFHEVYHHLLCARLREMIAADAG